MTDEAKRLFFALDCPPAQRKAIAQWRGELGLRTGMPVPTDNFHLTLLFLGAVPFAQINEVCEAAAQVRTPGEASAPAAVRTRWGSGVHAREAAVEANMSVPSSPKVPHASAAAEIETSPPMPATISTGPLM